ncbi:MAG: ABC transporter permease subunit [Anaerolineales bacterium]|nr:ABC transporter permease subunit [Anaerolineales bacterium]
MDPTTNPTLKQATELIRAGDRHQASVLLAKFVEAYPHNEHAWHILSYALEDKEQQIYVLKRALRINPSNPHVKARLDKFSPPAPKSEPPRQPAPISKPISQPAVPIQEAPPPRQGSLLQTAAAAGGIGAPSSPLTRAASQPIVVSKPAPKIPTYEIPKPTKAYGLWHRIKTRATISWRRTKMNWRIFAMSPLAIIGLILIVLFGIMAVAHPILMNTVWPRGIYDPATGFDMMIFPHPSLPGSGHILGTDSLGRDVLSMILAATTPTFTVGITAALTTAIVGTLLSVTAAYFQGKVDFVITNMADVFLLFPAPIIMVIIGARFRDLGPVQLGLFYGLVTGAGATTIVMRAQALQVAAKPFMEAAHVAGGGPWHIITKHLIPSVMPLAALQMMIAVTGAVVADGFISFFGITRTVNNWGTIIYDAFIYGNISGFYGPPWHMLIPAAACFSLFALGFYLVSRGLHRVTSPSLREDH